MVAGAAGVSSTVGSWSEIDVAKPSSTTSSMKYGEISHQLTIANGTTSTISLTTGGTRSRSMTTKATAARAVPPKVNRTVRQFSNGASRMSGSMTTSASMTAAITAPTMISRRVIRLISQRTREWGAAEVDVSVTCRGTTRRDDKVPGSKGFPGELGAASGMNAGA